MTRRITTGRPAVRRPVLRTRPTTLRPARPARPALPAPDPETVPLHVAMHRVMRDVPAIPKRGHNLGDDYYYKTLDDVVLVLREACIRHGVLIYPVQVNKGKNPHGPMTTTDVHVTYKVVGPDGKSDTIQFVGEARAETDKGTPAAMSMTWKYGVCQVFMIPTQEDQEGDAHSLRLPRPGSQRTSNRPARAADAPHPSAVIPRQRRGEAPSGAPQNNVRPPVDAGVEAAADYLSRAATCTYQECRALYTEAEKAGAPGAVLAAIKLLGEKKREQEARAAAAGTDGGTAARDEGAPGGVASGEQPTATGDDPGHERAADRPQEPGGAEHQNPGPQSAGERERAVPPTPAHEPSAETAEHAAAIAYLWECAKTAGYDGPHQVADAFFQRHERVLEDGSPQEIRAFAAGMLPPGQPTGQDETGTHYDERTEAD